MRRGGQWCVTTLDQMLNPVTVQKWPVTGRRKPLFSGQSSAVHVVCKDQQSSRKLARLTHNQQHEYEHDASTGVPCTCAPHLAHVRVPSGCAASHQGTYLWKSVRVVALGGVGLWASVCWCARALCAKGQAQQMNARGHTSTHRAVCFGDVLDFHPGCRVPLEPPWWLFVAGG